MHRIVSLMLNPSPVATIIKKINQGAVALVTLGAYYLAILFSFYSAYLIRVVFLPEHFVFIPQTHMSKGYSFLVIPLIYLSLIIYEQLVTKRLPFWDVVARMFKVCLFATIIAIEIVYFIQYTEKISRIFMLLSSILTFIYLVITYYVVTWILLRCGLWQKPVIVVGAGKTAQLIANAFENDHYLGYKIVGVIEDHYVERPLTCRYPVIGSFENAEHAIVASGIKDVIIATPGLKREALTELVYRIQPYVNNLRVIPNLFGLPLGNLEVETFFMQKLIMLKINNNFMKISNHLFKKIFDMTLGLLGFILIMPLLVLLAILIKLDSPGPMMHIAKRIGRNGREFDCYKFRSMYLDSDNLLTEYFRKNPKAEKEWEQYAKLRDYDPRVTRVGKWMRRFSLDELPQIINVILGNMSLVGPRPYLPREMQQIGYYGNTIFTSKPGITGLWQVSGRNDVDFNGRLELDAWYVRNWSVWLDLTLLMKTFKVVLQKSGAY